MPAEPTRFTELFNYPSIEGMYALSPREFEHFVAYVLRRAGYDAKEVGPHWLRGVDLEMRRPGYSRIVGGVECKRYQPGDLVPAGVVARLLGAAAVSRPGAKPYVITTSDFHENAHKVANAGAKRAHLMNGSQLVRYITYIRGSRTDGDDVIAMMSPEPFCGRAEPLATSARDATVLTVANNKGGVGKTTTAFYLGGELARRGQRVLLIDMDAQANLTDYCFPERESADSDDVDPLPNIAHYFSGEQPLQALVRSTSREHLNIIPSDDLLTLRDLGGTGHPDIESQFMRDVRELGRQPLPGLGGTPAWIIIDTPPAMTVFTRAGLAAADYVIAPLRPRRRSLPGTAIMLQKLQTMNALTGVHATFLGTVITHWDGLQGSQRFVDVILPLQFGSFGGQAFTVKIPLDNQLETLGPGANTTGANAYRLLAEEVLRYIESRPVSPERAEVMSHVIARGED
jgi:chromosome partitioning protein